MQQSGKFQKSYQPRSENTPDAVQSAPRTGSGGFSRPAKSLSVRQKDSEEYVNITGLFLSQTRDGKGEYLSGKPKDGTQRFYVYTNKKVVNEFTHALMVKDMQKAGAKAEKIADLKPVKSKSGNDILVGESPDGDIFYINDSKPLN